MDLGRLELAPLLLEEPEVVAHPPARRPEPLGHEERLARRPGLALEEEHARERLLEARVLRGELGLPLEEAAREGEAPVPDGDLGAEDGRVRMGSLEAQDPVEVRLGLLRLAAVEGDDAVDRHRHGVVVA